MKHPLNRMPRPVSLILVFILVLLSCPLAPAQRFEGQPQQKTRIRQNQTRLVLLIAVDQFRYDYLERFGDMFAKNGLRRLINKGASWTDSNYDHTPTYTAPGHGTMMTGAFPAETGIVGNEWIERSNKTVVASISDSTVQPLGGGAVKASPRRLMSSTLGDEMRLVTNDRSKVIGISVKDRSAILPAGRHATAAYWFDNAVGNMVSSTYYFSQLPAWVNEFNSTRPADEYFKKEWKRLRDPSDYLERAGPDDQSWERAPRTFNYIISGGLNAPGPAYYRAFEPSPFSNDLLVKFAKQAITNENLGKDNYTDVLTVSFSANDLVGHRYGPYSQEVMDMTLRVDRQIGELLDFVDDRVGLSRTLVAFTADHGVAPVAEHAEALKLGGPRLDEVAVLDSIKGAIRARYNPGGTTPDPTDDYILTSELANASVYFDYDALKRDNVKLDEIADLVAAHALTIPGIARTFTRAQLLRGSTSITDPIERRVVHGFYPNRSGDVLLILEPFLYMETTTATHGTPYSYDTHVPTIIMGPRVKAGRYRQAASPADIAPTLAALLDLTGPSNATGRVLAEAIKN